MRRLASTIFGLVVSATIVACATGLVEQIPATDGGTSPDASPTDGSGPLVCEGGCPQGQVCSQGQCKLNCASGENKCGSICTNVQTDPKNCGQCGNPCNVGFVCKAGQCALDCGTKTACGSTDDGGADAGLVCVDTQTDTLNCGACGKSCASLTQPPNATLGCVAGNCAITKCTGNFDDCNKQANDGCEADLMFDKNNCGKCGTACSGGTPVCGSGKCIATTCGNNVIDSGEKCDGTLNVPQGNQVTCRPGGTKNECKFDFSGVTQLYCNGTCSWGGASSCDQADADIFCKLKTGSSTSTATAFTVGTATTQPGFCCPGGGYGQNLGTMPEYGVNISVWYQGTSLQANHGSGSVISSVTCSP